MLELLNFYLTLAMSSGRFAYYAIPRNNTTNDSISHMSGGMQGVYSEMLGVVRTLFCFNRQKVLISDRLHLKSAKYLTHVEGRLVKILPEQRKINK